MKKRTGAKSGSSDDAVIRRLAKREGTSVGELNKRARAALAPVVEKLSAHAPEVEIIERKVMLALEVLYGLKREKTGGVRGIVEGVKDYLALRENRRAHEIDEIVKGSPETFIAVVRRMMDDANAKAGLSKPPPMPAQWFETATGGALKANALRKTTKPVVKVGRGKSLRFCPLSVMKLWPEYADLIHAALRRIE
ncbi:MAG: hypothetical protein IT432_04755 [Phycisphaerales bacterium]|nr:hypothetical protein [Phycisphaerales bacterium]